MEEGRAQRVSRQVSTRSITKQKRSTSVGRRTPETEALYDAFVTGRDQLAARSAAVEPILENQAPVSKAFRLDRFSGDGARVVTALWEDKLFDHVLALGNNAISAYEVEYARLVNFSARATRRSQPFFDPDRNKLAFVIPDDEEFVDAMLRSMQKIDKTYLVIGTTITGERGPRIWIYGREQIYSRVFKIGDPSDVETVELLFDLPTVSTVAIPNPDSPFPSMRSTQSPTRPLRRLFVSTPPSPRLSRHLPSIGTPPDMSFGNISQPLTERTRPTRARLATGCIRKAYKSTRYGDRAYAFGADDAR